MKKWKEYKYYGQAGPESMMYRPMIGMDVLIEGEWMKSIAMIDSGCDRTLVNASFAKLLGIDEKKCKKMKIGGIFGPSAEGFRSNITLRFEQFENRVFDLDVLFVPDMAFGALLGHGDFFEIFDIRFEKKKRKFYMKEVEQKSSKK